MSEKRVAVIDYNAGNAPSVINALNFINIPAGVARCGEELLTADAIILPGVGAADATMAAISEKGPGGVSVKDAIIERVIKQGVPFLGICVGLQILFERSEEGAGGATECLGFIGGEVRRFNGAGQRVPQIGWNDARFKVSPGGRPDPLFEGLGEGGYFYYVNSYYAAPSDGGDVIAETDYGVTFAAAVRSQRYKNVCAAQFHIEKSGEAGLMVLKNFAAGALALGGGIC